MRFHAPVSKFTCVENSVDEFHPMKLLSSLFINTMHINLFNIHKTLIKSTLRLN
jgi:hypothetical protein